MPYLENVDIREVEKEEGFYLPVQRVCRPDHTFRGFQGQIESGSISVGDGVITLPSNEHANVKSILIGDKQADTADAGRTVTIQLDREVDVSRGCVLVKDTNIPISNSFAATLLWMDDEPLTPGKEYLVKIGTKQIAGILKNIQYKIDVNTGEFLPTDSLSKNEIAVCDLILQEAIVVDEFKKHKTLGELILIDRITNMTSACGVIEEAKVDNGKDIKCAFAYKNLKAKGDIFEEYYYNIETMAIIKTKQSGKTYTIGDEIPVEGESYHYPDTFDVIVFRDKVVVKVRNKKITEILPLLEYQYSQVTLINGRGFAIQVNNEEEYQAFISDLEQLDYVPDSQFFNKWIVFETYRKIVFQDLQSL